MHGDIAGQVGLVEKGDDRVPLLKTSDTGTGGYNGAGTIGGRNPGDGERERVFALWNRSARVFYKRTKRD